MTELRTGSGDPALTVALLWDDAPGGSGRGPRPRLGTRAITLAAVQLADAEGAGAVTMRALAQRLGLASANGLYTYVPSKAELVDLMVDHCFGEFVLEPLPTDATPATRVAAVADANLALFLDHPWLAGVNTDRPPLGPGQLGKYERELATLEPLGFADEELDLVLGLILATVRAHSAPIAGAAPDAEEAAWWATAGPELARRVQPEQYPLATRVGSAAGEAQGRATDPRRAYRFAIERITAGILAR